MRLIAKNNRGFTLIEILVVLAISMILVGLVLGPVVQAFKMTRQAQAMVDAQDSARQAMEMISRELGQAMFVFDNSVTKVDIYDDKATPPELMINKEGPIQLPVRQANNTIKCFTLPNGKIDIVLPKITMHCGNPEHPAGEPRDYPRGNEAWPPCPTCGSTEINARPSVPLQQDVTIVRYFLGLRYNNPTRVPSDDEMAPIPEGEGLFGWKSPYIGRVEPGEENQVVLYRVEFDPHDNSLFPPDMPVVERLSDPIFFYRSANNGESSARPCFMRWAEIAQVVGMGKYQDLVVGTYDDDGNVTAVDPATTFRFSAINNDTLTGTYSSDASFDYPDAVPAVYEAQYGYWIGNNRDYSAMTPEELDLDSNYDFVATVYRNDNKIAYSTRIDDKGDLVVRKREYDGTVWSDPETTFNISKYVATGEVTGTDDAVEMAFTLDLNHGKINFALNPPRATGAVAPCILDPAKLNKDFHDLYDGVSGPADTGSARRSALLTTLDSTIPGNQFYLPRARIVPGSDRVIGPNATPGPRYGTPIRYERVPLALGDAGLNQYKINYETGEISFSPVYNQDLPVGGSMIFVDYKIHFNQDGDVVKCDYTTKSLVTVHLGMRIFDPDSGKPHAVDLNNSVKVRNALR